MTLGSIIAKTPAANILISTGLKIKKTYEKHLWTVPNADMDGPVKVAGQIRENTQKI